MKTLLGNFSFKLFIIILLVLLFIFAYRNLIFISTNYFTFHDNTQMGRIIEYANALKEGNFPPRLAFNMSFGLGHPMLSLYAPLSYIVGSTLYLIYPNITSILSFTWLIPLVIATFFAFKSTLIIISQKQKIQNIFTYLIASLTTVLFFTNNYLALDIFVRGNLAEIWFLANFVLCNYLILKIDKPPKLWQFTFAFVLLILSHNALSPLSLVYFLVITLFHAHKVRIFTSMIFAIGLSSFYLIPLFLESSLTHAKEIALKTFYGDHFLCINQLIQDNFGWRFGASNSGCVDGMVFALNKASLYALIVVLATIILYIWRSKPSFKLLKSIDFKQKFVLIQGLTLLLSIFLTLEISKPLWDLFQRQIALMQFPWRFLIFLPFALSILFSLSLKYLFQNFSKIYFVIIVSICVLLLPLGMRNFHGNTISKNEIEKNYASSEFIRNALVYSYLELTPKIVDMKYYQAFHPNTLTKLPPSLFAPASGNIEAIVKNTSQHKIIRFTSEQNILLNVHNFPNWRFLVNGSPWYPTKFDPLGRPIWEAQNPSSIVELQIIYSQSKIQKIANTISAVFLAIFLAISFLPLGKVAKKCLLTLRQN